MRDISNDQKVKKFPKVELKKMQANKNRRDIYQYIKENPGITFTEIQNDLNKSSGVVSYHISVLSNYGYIAVCKTRNNTKYFDSEIPEINSRQLLSANQQRILECIERRKEMTQKEIVEETNVSQPTVSRNLRTLRQEGYITISFYEDKMHIKSGGSK